MIDAIDKIVANPNQYTITHANNTMETVNIVKSGVVTENGTDINRAFLMALQGFQNKTTIFNSDGSITETYGVGQTKTTTFNENGSITETFVGNKTITKTTTFNSDGSVTEVISE